MSLPNLWPQKPCEMDGDVSIDEGHCVTGEPFFPELLPRRLSGLVGRLTMESTSHVSRMRAIRPTSLPV